MLFPRVGGNMRILAVLFIGLLSVGARAEGPSPIFPDCVALVQVVELTLVMVTTMQEQASKSKFSSWC